MVSTGEHQVSKPQMSYASQALDLRSVDELQHQSGQAHATVDWIVDYLFQSVYPQSLIFSFYAHPIILTGI